MAEEATVTWAVRAKSRAKPVALRAWLRRTFPERLVFAWAPNPYFHWFTTAFSLLNVAAFLLRRRVLAALSGGDWASLLSFVCILFLVVTVVARMLSALTRVAWDERSIQVRLAFGTKRYRWRDLHEVRRLRVPIGPLKNFLVLFVDPPFAMPLLDPLVKRRRCVFLYLPHREHASIYALHRSARSHE
ncbi:MAG TPA: hypothetical protein VI072_22700 [Polyangiaceae bacterium]